MKKRDNTNNKVLYKKSTMSLELERIDSVNLASKNEN